MQMQMGMGAGPNVGFEAPKMYKQERVSLRLHQHEWELEFAEKRLLGEPIPEKPKPTAASATAPTSSASRNAKFNKTSKRR